MEHNELKKYILKVEGFEQDGSGVLFRPKEESSFIYILTAKHNFRRNSQDVEQILIEDIEDFKEEINIYPYKDLQIKKVIGLSDISIDLVLLVVDNSSISKNLLENIPILKVFNDEFKICTVVGYPIIRNRDASVEYLPSLFSSSNDEKNTFEVRSEIPLHTHTDSEMDTIPGISGGGVFVKGNDKVIYLAGIEIGYMPIRNLVCISLRDVIGELNEKLNSSLLDKIEFGGFQLYDKFGIDMDKLDLNQVKEDLETKNPYIKNLLNQSENILDELKNTQSTYRQKLDEGYKNTHNLAKAFLYNGIVFHENKDYNRATRQFKKAIKLDLSLEVHFANSKFQRKNLTSEKKSKIEEEVFEISLDKEDSDEIIIQFLKDSLIDENTIKESQLLHLNHLLYKDEKKYKDDIIKYTKELSDYYFEHKDFTNSEKQLIGLQTLYNELEDDESINKTLLNIYQKSEYEFLEEGCINKKFIFEKLSNLLKRFSSNSEEYASIEKMIGNLVDSNKQYINIDIKIENLKSGYDKKIEDVSFGLSALSNKIVDKNVLENIDNMLKNLTHSHFEIKEKLEKDRGVELRRFYRHLLNQFKNISQKNNEKLVTNIQKISSNDLVQIHQLLSNINGKFHDIDLNTETDTNEDFLKEELLRKSNSIIEQEVKLVYEKNQVLNEELLEEKDEVIKALKEGYEEYIQNLKVSVIDKEKEIQGLISSSKNMNQELVNLQSMYENLRKINNKDTNDMSSIELMEYKNKISILETSLELFKNKNELLVNDLKGSIKLSSDTATRLVHLEKSFEEKITLVEDRFKKIKYNPKNERRLRKIFKDLITLEKTLEEIRVNSSISSRYDQNITLRLVENDLEKIEKIMRKRKSISYTLYLGTRFVILGVIGMTALLLFEPLWEIYKQLLSFLGLI